MGTLAKKVAIVTGASQGIGRGIALAFAKEGAHVVVAARNADNGLSVVKEIQALGGTALFRTCDVSNRAQVERAVDATIETWGGVDILVNNAHDTKALMQAAIKQQSLFNDVTDDLLRSQFECGLMGTVWFMRACFPHMKKRGGGRVINFGSLAAIRGDVGTLAYSASKEAIRAATRIAAREWGQYGITVNCINPAVPPLGTEEQLAGILPTLPMRRMGDAEIDVGRTAVFLAGDDASYITGYSLSVDGGMAIDAGR